MKILILGGSGLLGKSLAPILINHGHEVVVHGKQNPAQVNFDIMDSRTFHASLNRVRPEVIINLIALTDVDYCEEFPNEAYKLNVRCVMEIRDWILKNNGQCHLIQISTDHVYDNQDLNLSDENQVSLNNFYSFSKFSGELAASLIPCTVLRTNFFGRSRCVGRKSFTDWIFEGVSNQKILNVFDDIYFSPISMSSLSKFILEVILKKKYGIYNLGSHDAMSKAEFAKLFVKSLGLSTRYLLDSNSTTCEHLKARRPKGMAMDIKKFELCFDVTLPSLLEEIEKVAKEYESR